MTSGVHGASSNSSSYPVASASGMAAPTGWNTVNGFSFSPMHYQFSCMPSCISTILKNMGIAHNEEMFESSWESIQTSNPPGLSLAEQAPSIQEIARNIPLTVPSSVQVQILGEAGPHSFDPNTARQIEGHLATVNHAVILASPYDRGHAQMIFHAPQGYVHISASPRLTAEDIRIFSTLVIDFMELDANTHTGGVLARDVGADVFLCGGDYAILIS